VALTPGPSLIDMGEGGTHSTVSFTITSGLYRQVELDVKVTLDSAPPPTGGGETYPINE
jgi:hypothetical protein